MFILPAGYSNRNEDNAMHYEAPKLNNTYDATLAVQSVGRPDASKNAGGLPDIFPGTQECTPGAYEADE